MEGGCRGLLGPPACTFNCLRIDFPCSLPGPPGSPAAVMLKSVCFSPGQEPSDLTVGPISTDWRALQAPSCFLTHHFSQELAKSHSDYLAFCWIAELWRVCLAFRVAFY